MTDSTPKEMPDKDDPVEPGQAGPNTPSETRAVPRPPGVPATRNMTPGRRPMFGT